MGDQTATGLDSRRQATLRLTILLVLVLAVGTVIYSIVSYFVETSSMEDKALTEARTLSTEILASWYYVDDIQDRINYNSDGTYDFKDVYCSIAGKRIAQLFNGEIEDYNIRFTRENPRTGEDAPDEFERAGLETFEQTNATEYYSVLQNDGEPTLRYMRSLEISGGCLSCHGSPRGSIDEVGYAREGMELGDLAGAVSVTIPLASYTQSAFATSVGTILFFLLLAACMILVVRFMLKRIMVDPVEQKNEQLQAVSDAKSDLLAVVSHELRTPLASIIAFTDTWSKDVQDLDIPENEQVLVGEVKRNSEVLLDMVNNTIDSVRIDAGKYELTYTGVDLDDLLGAINAVARPIAHDKNLTYTCTTADDLPIVLSDWEALRKIVMNLVGNALKFTNEGDQVNVDVCYDFDRAQLVIAVKDTGIGIDERDFDWIFERFSEKNYQPSNASDVHDSAGQNTQQYVGASGLGLSLVKNLVELMGGSIEVKSELSVGSTFTVRIPANCIEGED